MKNRILAVLLILAVIGFGVLIVTDRIDTARENEELAEISRQYNEYLNALLDEQAAIEEELKNYDVNDIGEAGKGYSGYLYLVTEPRYEVDDEVRPVLSDRGTAGHLCLSESSFPGDWDNLAYWQTYEMMDEGWDLVLTVTENTDIRSLLERIADDDLPLPSAAYFPDAGCLEKQAPALREAGIDVAVVRELPETPENSPLTLLLMIDVTDPEFGTVTSGMSDRGQPFVVGISYNESDETYGPERIAAAADHLSGLSVKALYFPELKYNADMYYSSVSRAYKERQERYEQLTMRREEIEDLISSDGI